MEKALMIHTGFFLLTFLFFRPMAYTQAQIETGDTLFVAASSGLNMRDAAGLSSNKIVAIPYGASVKTIQDQEEKIFFEVEEQEGFTINGYWQKVEYEGKQGYVFSGYLTRFPLPDENTSSLEGLFRKIHQSSHKYDGSSKESPCFSTTYYEGPVIQTENYCGESGGYGSILLPTATLSEAYFMMKAMFFVDGKHKITSVKEGNLQFSLLMIEPDVGCEVFLYAMQGGMVIEYGCYC